MNGRECNNEKTKQRRSSDEHEKGSIIAFADTIVEPNTMVVLGFYVAVLERDVQVRGGGPFSM